MSYRCPRCSYAVSPKLARPFALFLLDRHALKEHGGFVIPLDVDVPSDGDTGAEASATQTERVEVDDDPPDRP